MAKDYRQMDWIDILETRWSDGFKAGIATTTLTILVLLIGIGIAYLLI